MVSHLGLDSDPPIGSDRDRGVTKHALGAHMTRHSVHDRVVLL